MSTAFEVVSQFGEVARPGHLKPNDSACVVVSMYWEEFGKDVLEPPSEPRRLRAVAPAGILVLNRFWPVYGVGCFGAFLVELNAIYQERTKLPRLPWYYWPVSLLMVIASGGLVVLYGTQEVNALLAVQLGATAPLLVKRMQR